MRRFFAIVIALSVLFAAGCAKAPGNDASSATVPPSASPDQKALDTTLGYAPSEVESPDWLESIWGWDTCGDCIWLGVTSADGVASAACYDTLNDQWQRFELLIGDARNPSPVSFSATGDSIWILFRESNTAADAKNGTAPEDLGYFLLYMDLANNLSSFSGIPFDGSPGTESSSSDICSVQAIDSARALLTTYETSVLIDQEANLIQQSPTPIAGEILHLRIDNELYIYLWNDGYAPLDADTLQFGAVLPLNHTNSISSNAGHYLYTEDYALHSYNLATAENAELFKWTDAALSYKTMGGRTGLENSAGDFFYPDSSGLIKVTQTLIPEKTVLALACFGDSGSDMTRPGTSYTCLPELMDAIIRFNNTDPEYKIEIKPMVYDSAADRDRMLIELATSNDIDVIDTSLLPDNAVDTGLLVDILPYIDADTELSRDDFIEPLLNAMMKNGGIFEYTAKFTILTLITHRDMFTDRAAWTADYVESLNARHSELKCLSREQVLEDFISASTAEFIDWNGRTSSFDSEAFQKWLRFLNELPDTNDGSADPLLFQISTDLAGDAGYWLRYALADDYAIAGFPDAAGSGSYFVKLDHPLNMERTSLGSTMSMGIMASGKHHDGAWRFLRTLILSDDGSDISTGIPALKKSFENAVEKAVTNSENDLNNMDFFNESDAQALLKQVYGTDKAVSSDETLLSMIRAETTRFFEGQISAQEATQQIQSRVTLYLAEQCG